MVTASARKKTPVTPLMAMSGRNTTIGVMVEPIERCGDLAQCAVNRFHASLTGVAVQGDVLNHHDGVIDHQADRGGQSAQGHEVEALAQQPSAR